MKEAFKTIPTFPDYEVSNEGRVRKNGIILRVHFSWDGYQKVTLKKGKRFYSQTIHPLVLETFVGPRPMKPTKHDACHNDGNKNNNHISNLRWATRKENVNDSIKHGTYTRGIKQGACKLTEKQVIEMREKYKNGINCTKLAKFYGISKANTHRIVTRVSWKHI